MESDDDFDKRITQGFRAMLQSDEPGSPLMAARIARLKAAIGGSFQMTAAPVDEESEDPVTPKPEIR